MLSLMVPLALKAAAAEMSVLMAYVRYWVCFLNLQLYKIMLLFIQEVRRADPLLLWHLHVVWVLFGLRGRTSPWMSEIRFHTE